MGYAVAAALSEAERGSNSIGLNNALALVRFLCALGHIHSGILVSGQVGVVGRAALCEPAA